MKTKLEDLPNKWREEASKVDPHDDYYTTRECHAADQKELCAAELEAALADQWQPIETAPKDDAILTFRPARPSHDICYFFDGQWIGKKSVVVPTHWMPLPAAPTPPKP